MNDLNDPIIKAEIAKLGLKPGANNQPAVPVGSRQVLPEPTPAPAKKKKKIQVELETACEARLIREAAVKGMSAKEYLNQIVSEALTADIGKATITAPSFAGRKVTAPSKNFGGADAN